VVAPRRGAVNRKTAPARNAAAVRPAERRGTPRSGRIVTLFVGQGHGFIRLTNDRDVFFHRSDVGEGTSFNDLAVGDAVTFELLEDDVSGPRALRVERRRARR
jgi:cold shock CspA family protein